MKPIREVLNVVGCGNINDDTITKFVIETLDKADVIMLKYNFDSKTVVYDSVHIHDFLDSMRHAATQLFEDYVVTNKTVYAFHTVMEELMIRAYGLLSEETTYAICSENLKNLELE